MPNSNPHNMDSDNGTTLSEAIRNKIKEISGIITVILTNLLNIDLVLSKQLVLFVLIEIMICSIFNQRGKNLILSNQLWVIFPGFILDGAWFYFTMKYCVVVVFRQILFVYKYVLDNTHLFTHRMKLFHTLTSIFQHSNTLFPY